MTEMLRREPFFKLYIDIQKIYSEIVIRIEPSRYSDIDLTNPQVKLRMMTSEMVVPHIDMNFDMSDFITNSKRLFSLEFGSDYFYGKRYNMLTVDGLLSLKNVAKLQEKINEFTGISKGEIFDHTDEFVNPSGVAQLLIAWKFLEKLNTILNELEKRCRSEDQ